MLSSEPHSDHAIANAIPARSVIWVSHHERWFSGFNKIPSTRSFTDAKLERTAMLPYMNIGKWNLSLRCDLRATDLLK